MLVLGAVEMLREWQRANPAQAPRVCVPRNVRSGDLILAVQQYIDDNKAWQNKQDATTAVIAAFKARCPC
jgi:Rap1a immunity proteins